ncbi:hypothetical protein D3C81_1603630 [compost metagenome]
MEEIAPRKMIKFIPIYLQTDAKAREILIKWGLSSHFCCQAPSPTISSSVFKVPSGLKKNKKIKPIATPFKSVGKNRIPLNQFLRRTLKLRIVAK